MVDEASLAAWIRDLQTRRPSYRIDTRDAVDRRFTSIALSEGLVIVTTPAGDVPASDAPYLLGIRLTATGERLLARYTAAGAG